MAGRGTMERACPLPPCRPCAHTPANLPSQYPTSAMAAAPRCGTLHRARSTYHAGCHPRLCLSAPTAPASSIPVARAAACRLPTDGYSYYYSFDRSGQHRARRIIADSHQNGGTRERFFPENKRRRTECCCAERARILNARADEL
jgi:hypothetical protein